MTKETIDRRAISSEIISLIANVVFNTLNSDEELSSPPSDKLEDTENKKMTDNKITSPDLIDQIIPSQERIDLILQDKEEIDQLLLRTQQTYVFKAYLINTVTGNVGTFDQKSVPNDYLVEKLVLLEGIKDNFDELDPTQARFYITPNWSGGLRLGAFINCIGGCIGFTPVEWRRQASSYLGDIVYSTVGEFGNVEFQISEVMNLDSGKTASTLKEYGVTFDKMPRPIPPLAVQIPVITPPVAPPSPIPIPEGYITIKAIQKRSNLLDKAVYAWAKEGRIQFIELTNTEYERPKGQPMARKVYFWSDIEAELERMKREGNLNYTLSDTWPKVGLLSPIQFEKTFFMHVSTLKRLVERGNLTAYMQRQDSKEGKMGSKCTPFYSMVELALFLRKYLKTSDLSGRSRSTFVRYLYYIQLEIDRIVREEKLLIPVDTVVTATGYAKRSLQKWVTTEKIQGYREDPTNVNSRLMFSSLDLPYLKRKHAMEKQDHD